MGSIKMLLKSQDIKEFFDVLFNKKLIRHGMKRIQSKLLELEPMMLLKFLCVLLMIKDTYQMMALIV